MGKTVYFLGAGATKDVVSKAPLNEDLVKKALKDFHISPEAKRLNDFIHDLFHQRDNPPIDNQIWNLLDYIIQRGTILSPSYTLEEIKDLRRCLFNLIIQEFKISLEAIEPKIYEKFIVKVKLIDYSIISTNYDILIDNALTKAIGLNYGAKVRTTITGEFKISGLRRPGFYDVGISVNESDKLLLKIHGSLNWLYCPKCDEVDITVYEKGAERTLDGSYYCFDKKCTCRYEPLLITPTMFKNYENRFIKETWDYAEKELTNAENIVFVGYALKYEDYQIRCLLMNALLNKIENYKKVIVIEKKPENNKEKKYIDNVKNKYQELYGDIVEFRPIGFTEYINNL